MLLVIALAGPYSLAFSMLELKLFINLYNTTHFGSPSEKRIDSLETRLAVVATGGCGQQGLQKNTASISVGH